MNETYPHPQIAIYPGSFDPPTEGHLWMISQGSKLFEKLIVAIGTNPSKTPYFNNIERLRMVTEITSIFPNVTTMLLGNEYLIHFAQAQKANYLLRGIRSIKDYNYESTMRQINGGMNPGITTVFLIPPHSLIDISSSTVKDLVGPNGWEDMVKKFVPENVFDAIIQKHKENLDVRKKLRPIKGGQPLFFKPSGHSDDKTEDKETD